MMLLIEVGLRATILIAVAAFVAAVMPRASAATRHVIWTLTVLGLLLLPLGTVGLPTWEVEIPVPQSVASDPEEVVVPGATGKLSSTPTYSPAAFVDDEPRASRSLSWFSLLIATYVLGVLVCASRLLRQIWTARRLAREAVLVTDTAWTTLFEDCVSRIGLTPRPLHTDGPRVSGQPVTLRRSAELLMPTTMGALVPTIVIPAIADTWTEDRRRAVLLHELSHVARRDCLTQLLAAVTCAIYWCHPLSWYVSRRLRIERELACDDRVLTTGTVARDYAGHLLDISYGWSGHRAPALSVSMSGSRKLEGRMLAILDAARNRATPTRRAWLTAVALAAALLVPVAAISTRTVQTSVNDEVMNDNGDERSAEARAQSASAASAQSRDTSGTWELRRGQNGNAQLSVKVGDASFNGVVDASTLAGQPIPTDGPVRMSVAREAGTFEVEGTMRAGAGSGTFRFVPSQGFVRELTARGLASPANHDLMTFAIHDVGLAFVNELLAQKYVIVDLSQIVTALHHGIRLEYVREMGQLGYRLGVLDSLIRLRDHGVGPEYVRDLRAAGVGDLTPDDLVRGRDHGVAPAYIVELRKLGYTEMPFDAIVRARDHGVTVDYVRSLQPLGNRFSMDDVIRARDHGVSPEFINALHGLGYTALSLDLVIRARDHGVTPEYVREMRAQGLRLELNELIRARDHGVTADVVSAFSALGYDRLPIDTLIRLRDHGVTPDFAAEARKQNPNLSVDELIRLRDRSRASIDETRLKEHLVAFLNDVGEALQELVRDWNR